MTKYAILSKQGAAPGESGDTTLWKMEKMVDAATAKAAVSAHVKASGAEKGTYVAVPVRSWVPITVTAERKVQIRFS